MSDIIQIQTTENKLLVTEQNNELVIQEQGTNRIELQSIGAQGPVGQGVPSGGTYGQILVKNSSTNFDTSWQDGVLITTVRNNTGATVTAGTLVYLNGMLGNRPTIAKALATSDATSARTYGMVAINIPNNSDGPVVHAGQAKNLNTSGVPEGVTLYLSPSVAGGYTSVKPSAPNHLVYVGICTRAHPTQGTIEVTITNGFELDELHNVAISSPANKQALVYNSSTQLWNNYSLTAADVGAESALGFTPENVANKSTSTSLGNSSTLYPSQGAVKGYVDTALTGKVDVTRQVATAAPLTGGGALSGDLSLGITQADGSTNGYLTATDWNTFNSKQAALGFTPENVGNKSTSTSLGTSDALYPTQNAVKVYVDNAVAGGGGGSVPDATTTTKGIIQLAGDLAGTASAPTVPGLAGKANASVTISTSAPLSGGGDLSVNRTLSISQATTSADGYLSSTDWNTFNNKQAALGFTPENVANKATSLTSPDNTKYPTTLAVSTGLGTKQDTLVSGTNIKTINGSSILGSGNLVVSGGGGLAEAFETVSKNLKSYDYSIAYTGDLVDEITYNLGGGLSIVKSFGYNIDDTVSTIVLSGDTPSGIELTKTFTYTLGKVTSVGYS